jgi:hypothetical protein
MLSFGNNTATLHLTNPGSSVLEVDAIQHIAAWQAGSKVARTVISIEISVCSDHHKQRTRRTCLAQQVNDTQARNSPTTRLRSLISMTIQNIFSSTFLFYIQIQFYSKRSSVQSSPSCAAPWPSPPLRN